MTKNCKCEQKVAHTIFKQISTNHLMINGNYQVWIAITTLFTKQKFVRQLFPTFKSRNDMV